MTEEFIENDFESRTWPMSYGIFGNAGIRARRCMKCDLVFYVNLISDEIYTCKSCRPTIEN